MRLLSCDHYEPRDTYPEAEQIGVTVEGEAIVLDLPDGSRAVCPYDEFMRALDGERASGLSVQANQEAA